MTATTYYDRYKWYLLIGIAIFSILLNINTINHSFLMDDYLVIGWNQSVQRGLDGLSEIWTHGYLYGFNGTNSNTYRPLTLSSFAIENHLFGGSPFGFHLVHVLMYALLCTIVLRLAFLIFPEKPPFLAIAIAILFTTHAVHTEVVANVKSRDEIYAMLFGIASLIYLIKYHSSSNKMFLWLSLLLYLGGLFSKENTITLIPIFPFILYFFKNKNLKKSILGTLIYLAPLFIYFLIRALVLDSLIQDNSIEWRIPYNNTLFAASTYTQELATNFTIFLKYIQLAIFPITLVHDYSIETFKIVNFTNGFAILGLFILTIAVIVSKMTFRSRSPISFAILFFLITFSITSNFITKIGSTLGERFLFLPSFGIVILISFVLFKIFEKTKPKLNIPVYFIIAMFLTSFYAWKTIDRNSDWENAFSLYLEDIKSNPKSSRINEGLAHEYRKIVERSNIQTEKQAAANKAIYHYQQSLNYIPDNGDIYYNIGVTYSFLGRNQDALFHYQKALVRKNNHEENIHFNMGLCYAEQYNYEKAIVAFNNSLKLNSNSIKAWNNLAYAYFSIKNYQSAINAFEKCNILEGGKNSNHTLNLGVCYHFLKNYEQAKKYYELTLKIDPNNVKAKTNLEAIKTIK